MSAEQQLYVSPSFPFALGGVEPPSSPQAEMETLRRLVSERMTAAVDDILGVFVKTVARYREQIDRQRRQLDSLRSEEGSWNHTDPLPADSWIKICPDEPSPTPQPDGATNKDEMVTDSTAAAIKMEELTSDFSCAAEGAAVGQHFTKCSGTEGGLREPAQLWKSEGMEEPEGQSLPPNPEQTPSADPPQPPQPTFRCKVCRESFQKLGYLFTHSSAHLKDCSLCGKHLEHPETLKVHLRVHRKKSFRCGVCGQSFTLRGNLTVHLRIHSGERPYGCSVCGKSFGRRATLVRHVRSHTGEKPFSCSHCGRGFVEKGNLKVHMRTHTGEQPYWCSNCDRRFGRLSSFYKHPCQRRALAVEALNT